MRASRLRLNPTKTQVMWLGSSQQLKLINDNSVLSTQLKVMESVCDLGVTLDSPLSLSYQVATLCRSGFYLTPPVASSCTITTAVLPSIHFVPSGLLQLPVVCVRQQNEEAAVSPERCCTSDYTGVRRVPQQLHWLSVRRRVDCKVACLVHQSLSDHAPRY